MAGRSRKRLISTGISLITTLVVVPLAYWFIVAAIDNAIGWERLSQDAVLIILAAAAFLIGVFWISWAYSYLLFVGEGMSQDELGTGLEPTHILITTGPYAYVRHPAAIGLLFLLLGVALLQRSISGLVLLPVIAVGMLPYHMIFEENALLKRFGAEYETYREHVPFMIPRLRPYIH
ncbi:MAG: methyltransferase [Armatimonadota bacterium]|nr:hypothetical protein [bacterium]